MDSMFDRSSHLRGDELDRLVDAREARAIVFSEGRVRVEGGAEPRLARWALSDLPSSDRSRFVFLGIERAAPIFLFVEDGEAWSGARGDLMIFREAAPLLSHDEAGLLAYGQGIVNWHARSRFCGRCGHQTESRKGGHARHCLNDSCGSDWFPRLDPVVIMLVTRGDEVLLVRHRRARSSTFFSAVAGFVEHGETLEDAAARELLEEVGLIAREIHYLSSQSWPLPLSLMLGFRVEVDAGNVRLDGDELLEARWFTREELRRLSTDGSVALSPSFSVAGKMIASWMNG